MKPGNDTSRIRWSNDERRLLARRMVELSNTAEGARLSNLKLLALAQEALPLDRRRDVPSWAPLRASFEPILEEFRNSPFFGAPPPVTLEEEDEALEDEGGPEPVYSSANGNHWQAGSVPDTERPAFMQTETNIATLEAPVDQTPTEAALLQALNSPRVLAALTALFQTAMGQALMTGIPQASGTGITSSHSRPSQAGSSPSGIKLRPKVLIAGLDTMEAEQLQQAMGSELDMRFWRKSDTRDQLRQTAKPCTVAVLMPNATEPGVEAILRSLKITIVRHTRGPEHLTERLQEMRENGLFNLLT